jgi:hypothetical protein
MTGYWKDPELEGIYVKRCKCGARPYHDRCPISMTPPQWIACNCGRMGVSADNKQEAIDNWNNDILSFTKWMTDEKLIESWEV